MGTVIGAWLETRGGPRRVMVSVDWENPLVTNAAVALLVLQKVG